MNGKALCRLATACCFGLAVSSLQAAGMDDDTNRLDGSSFEKTTPGSRFTSPNGSTQLDNGMIIKWGQATTAAFGTSAVVVFGTAFPTALLSLDIAVQGTALSGISATYTAATRLGFTINVNCLSLAGAIACAVPVTVRWSAKGY